MIALQLNNVTFSYPAGTTLEGLNWSIHNRARIGLVGANGSGKSTLLRLLLQQLPPDAGVVNYASGVNVGYLPQEITLDPSRTLLSDALTANPDIATIDANLHRVEASLADPAVYGDDKLLTRALNRQAQLLEAFEQADGPRYESRVKSTLRQLGFNPADFELPVSVLSGGQKKMLLLAKLVVNQPAVLLLDEPDNHLDLAGKARLEQFIHSFSGAVVIVSHDRYLLDEVANEIVEIAAGKLQFYKGNYSAYVVEKELRQLRQAQLYAAQQKEIGRLEAAIARFELWASLVIDERHIKQARNKRRQIEQMDKVDKPHANKQLSLNIDGWRGSDKVLQLIKLYKAFDDNLVLADLNLTLWHGERVGLVGPNGAGKSVLFRCINGTEAPSDGEVRLGPSVQMGVYTQEHQSLDYHKSLLETIRDTKAMYEHEAVAYLGGFNFDYQVATTHKVRELSGGERSRLQLATIILQAPNFLLLDEPTNNLDIQSAEALETALDKFTGTVFVISHDRYFLDKVVDRIVELDPDSGSLRSFDGGYTDYLAVISNE